MISSEKFSVKFKFLEPLLGSQPMNDTPASDFVRNKMLQDAKKGGLDISEELKEEEQTLPEALEKGTTGFHRDEKGGPLLLNYQIKGMLKEAGGLMNGLNGMKNLRNKIQSYVYIAPRRIPIIFQGEMQILERPLRGMTMQGPRVSLARSEMIPAGAKLGKIEVTVFKAPSEKMNVSVELMKELLEFSVNLGLGQWRNSGIYGMFSYEIC